MSAPAVAPPAAPQPKAGVKRELYAPDPKPGPSQELRAQRKAEVLGDVQKPQAAPAAPAPAEMREAPGKRAAVASRAEPAARAVSGLAKASPEQWLQGIADLRRQGRHEEADKALAEFRRAYPDYRISEAMLEKVEKK